ncbi:MAG TPA: hypothetical protein EYO59_07355 [Chromatiaceae bacterium]|nr:hypothetical protein [Chromatiaceae bacterium]
MDLYFAVKHVYSIMANSGTDTFHQAVIALACARFLEGAGVMLETQGWPIMNRHSSMRRLGSYTPFSMARYAEKYAKYQHRDKKSPVNKTTALRDDKGYGLPSGVDPQSAAASSVLLRDLHMQIAELSGEACSRTFDRRAELFLRMMQNKKVRVSDALRSDICKSLNDTIIFLDDEFKGFAYGGSKQFQDKLPSLKGEVVAVTIKYLDAVLWPKKMVSLVEKLRVLHNDWDAFVSRTFLSSHTDDAVI